MKKKIPALALSDAKPNLSPCTVLLATSTCTTYTLTSLDHPIQPLQQQRLKLLFASRPGVVHGEVDTSAGGVNFHVTRASKLECPPYNEDILMAKITMQSFV